MAKAPARIVDGEQIVQARIRGYSVRRIAREFDLAVDDVNDTLDAFATATLDKNLRRSTLALELERLDRITAVFQAKAEAGDVQSALLVTKIAERRGVLLGLACAPQGAAAPPPVIEVVAGKPKQTSTDRIKAALDRISGTNPDQDVQEAGQSPSSPTQ